ncbi:MAG: hypothetical protein AAGI34_03840 [Pseudomonadota bacterium]
MSRRPNQPADPYHLMKYVALAAADGIAAGWTLLLLLLWLDIGGFGTVVRSAEDGMLAMTMLAVFFGITFGMVGIAWRLMVILPNEPVPDEYTDKPRH